MTHDEIQELAARAIREAQKRREEREGTTEEKLEGIAQDGKEREEHAKEDLTKMVENSAEPIAKTTKTTLGSRGENVHNPVPQTKDLAAGVDLATSAVIGVAAGIVVAKQVYKDAKEKLENKFVSPDKYQPALEAKHQPPGKEAADIAQKLRENFERRHDQLGTDKQARDDARKLLERQMQEAHERRAAEDRARADRSR